MSLFIRSFQIGLISVLIIYMIYDVDSSKNLATCVTYTVEAGATPTRLDRKLIHRVRARRVDYERVTAITV